MQLEEITAELDTAIQRLSELKTSLGVANQAREQEGDHDRSDAVLRDALEVVDHIRDRWTEHREAVKPTSTTSAD